MQQYFAHLEVAAVTDQGRKRKNNEDAYGVFPRNGVFCVADGMGGATEGEFASRTVVDAVTAALANCQRYDRPLGREAMRICLSNAVNRASDYLYRRSQELGLGMTGTTFVAACLDVESPNLALAIHAGDSRLYRIRGRCIEQITHDHSAAALAGKDEKELNPIFRGVVMRAVGDGASADLETTALDIAEGDLLLLCSDGLTRMVADEEILNLVSQAQDPQTMVRALIDAANAAGGADNVTVVVVSIGVLPEPAATISAAEYAELEARTSSPGEMESERISGDTPSLTSVGNTYGSSTTSVREKSLFGADSEESLEALPKSQADAACADDGVLPETPPLHEGETDEPRTTPILVADEAVTLPNPSTHAPLVRTSQMSQKAGFINRSRPDSVKRSKLTRRALTGVAMCLLSGGVLIAQLKRMEADKGQKTISAHEPPLSVQEANPSSAKPADVKPAAEPTPQPPSTIIPPKKPVDTPPPVVVNPPVVDPPPVQAQRPPTVTEETAPMRAVAEDKPATLPNAEKVDSAVAASRPQSVINENKSELVRNAVVVPTSPPVQVSVQVAEPSKTKPEQAQPDRLEVQTPKQIAGGEPAVAKTRPTVPQQRQDVSSKLAVTAPVVTTPKPRPAEKKVVAKVPNTAQELHVLSQETALLERFLFAVSVSDDNNIKMVSQTLKEKAAALAKCGAAELVASDAQRDITEFVCALANVVAVLPFIADAWYVRIDTYEQKTSRSTDAENARQGVDKWSTLVQGCSHLGDLSNEKTRERLVELVRLTDAVMKQLQAVPGLTRTTVE